MSKWLKIKHARRKSKISSLDFRTGKCAANRATRLSETGVLRVQALSGPFLSQMRRIWDKLSLLCPYLWKITDFSGLIRKTERHSAMANSRCSAFHAERQNFIPVYDVSHVAKRHVNNCAWAAVTMQNHRFCIRFTKWNGWMRHDFISHVK